MRWDITIVSGKAHDFSRGSTSGLGSTCVVEIK